jgi:hypothetical protein
LLLSWPCFPFSVCAEEKTNMTTIATTAGLAVRPSYLEWGPVFAGAIAAAALSFLLLTFGATIGLTLTSPWPYEGVSAARVAIAVGIWAVLVQIASFAAGGYLSGRMRSGWDGTVEERHFRDGAHGFMVWATGVMFGAILLAIAGAATAFTAANSASMVAAGAASGAAAKGTETLARGPSDYAVDLLLRPAPGMAAQSAQPAGSQSAVVSADPGLRSETTRIFRTAIDNRALTQRDRDYLVQVVATRTGLPEAEAQKRVDEAVKEAQNLEVKAREAADKARKTAVITGFMAGASLLIGLAAACAGASLGGRHRDENLAPAFYGRRFW